MKIFVGESSSLPENKNYIKEAKEMGKFLAEKDHIYMQGNCIKGLMGITYKEFIKKSNKVLFLKEKNEKSNNKPNKKFKNFNDRNTWIINNADKVVFLPGGDGTIQEIATINQYCREHHIKNRAILINVDGCYDSLINMYKDTVKNKLNQSITFEEIFTIVNTTKEAINIIEK